MKALIIIIGDEILSGRTQEANLKHLALTLKNYHVTLETSWIIHDDLDVIVSHLKKAIHVADLVFVSGGLGPTRDDLTKMALATFLNVPVEESKEAKTLVTEQYSSKGRSWNPSSNNYHLLPKGVFPFRNPLGLAPGLCSIQGNKAIVFAPGVPREFQAMVDLSILPELERRGLVESRKIRTITIRTKRISEEKIFSEVAPELWDFLEQYGKVSSLPHFFGVDLVVTLKEDFNKEVILQQIKEKLRSSLLWENIWNFGDEELPEIIIKKASSVGLSFSIAESCTGGLISHLLTNVPGSSRAFKGSIVCYSNESKVDFLEVEKSLLDGIGPINQDVAKQMSLGAREKFNTDIAISVTGLAGPSSPVEDLNFLGPVHIGLSTPEGCESFFYEVRGGRVDLKNRFASYALLHLFEAIKLRGPKAP